ncbi:hypothetical protein [Bradyrhizobium sp. Ghvi]|uniref:hypothetical protein n=1 Tax=Bradyrhizobium sp. Ghvi TaxID=1855319 RepID=UPI001AECFDCB|nr:hypothetical protein [Bradyrhizobium sp. Ghvi]
MRYMLFAVTMTGVLSSLVLAYGMNLRGFESIPYVNLATTAAALSVQCFFLGRVRGVVGGPLSKIYLLNFIFVVVATIIGLLLKNSLIHILAWLGYFTVNLLSVLIQNSYSNTDYSGSDERFVSALAICAALMLIVKLLTKVLDLSSSLDSVLLLTFVVFFLSGPLPARYRLLGGLLLGSSLIGVTETGAWQLEGNRASYVAIYVGLLAAAVFQRQLVRLLPLAIVPVLLYFVALSLDRAVVDGFSRNIREAVLLIQGDSLSSHVATQQRFYEVDKVMDDVNEAGPIAYVIGLGLGRTIDMSASRDDSVQSASITGADKVNNVHFLHVAIFHKFGLIGLALHALMWLTIALHLFSVSARNCRPVVFFGALYLVVCIAYSASASITYFSSPYLGICLALLDQAVARHFQMRLHMKTRLAQR